MAGLGYWPWQLANIQASRPEGGLIQRPAPGILHQKQQVAAITNAEVGVESGFGALPVGDFTDTIDLAFGIGANLAVDTINLYVTNQPPAAEAEHHQGEAGEHR